MKCSRFQKEILMLFRSSLPMIAAVLMFSSLRAVTLAPGPPSFEIDGLASLNNLYHLRAVLYGRTNSPYEFCSFSKLSVTSPTSQLILQLFRRFTYITAHSPTLPLVHLRHNSFSNRSFASPTSQDLHLLHLVSRPSFLEFILGIKYIFCINKICPQHYGVDIQIVLRSRSA